MRALILFGILCITLEGTAQLFPQQSLYQYNSLPINPASAGREGALHATLSRRSMWQGVEGAPVTNYFAFHTPLKREQIALGVTMTHDKIGVSKKSGILVNGAYRLKLKENYTLAFGLTAGIVSSSNGWTDVNVISTNDASFAANTQGEIAPIVGAGLYLEAPKSFVGISVPTYSTLEKFGNDAYSNPLNFSLHFIGGHRVEFQKSSYLSATVLAKKSQNSAFQSELNLNFGNKELGEVGFGYRHKNAVIAMVQFRLTSQFRMAASYDFIYSMQTTNKGSYEVGLFYHFVYLNKTVNPRLY